MSYSAATVKFEAGEKRFKTATPSAALCRTVGKRCSIIGSAGRSFKATLEASLPCSTGVTAWPSFFAGGRAWFQLKASTERGTPSILEREYLENLCPSVSVLIIMQPGILSVGLCPHHKVGLVISCKTTALNFSPCVYLNLVCERPWVSAGLEGVYSELVCKAPRQIEA